MGRPPKDCVKCGILSDLEAERLDLSYKKVGRTDPEPAEVVIPTRRQANDDRDKLMFNAGRYAGGARDKVATDAHNLLQILLEQS
jgi:hypothetical protein